MRNFRSLPYADVFPVQPSDVDWGVDLAFAMLDNAVVAYQFYGRANLSSGRG